MIEAVCLYSIPSLAVLATGFWRAYFLERRKERVRRIVARVNGWMVE